MRYSASVTSCLSCCCCRFRRFLLQELCCGCRRSCRCRWPLVPVLHLSLLLPPVPVLVWSPTMLLLSSVPIRAWSPTLDAVVAVAGSCCWGLVAAAAVGVLRCMCTSRSCLARDLWRCARQAHHSCCHPKPGFFGLATAYH